MSQMPAWDSAEAKSQLAEIDRSLNGCEPRTRNTPLPPERVYFLLALIRDMSGDIEQLRRDTVEKPARGLLKRWLEWSISDVDPETHGDQYTDLYFETCEALGIPPRHPKGDVEFQDRVRHAKRTGWRNIPRDNSA